MLYVGRGRKSFAPEVSFNEVLHEYTIHGRKLSGVTRKICERMKLNFQDAESLVVERCDEGSQVHKWIQEWIDTGKFDTIHPGAKWVHDELIRRYGGADVKALAMSEVLVYDLKDYASAVDIIIQLSRLRDKSRRTMEISEVVGYENGEIKLNPLFQFIEEGEDENHKIIGKLTRTQNPMVHTYKLASAGLSTKV